MGARGTQASVLHGYKVGFLQPPLRFDTLLTQLPELQETFTYIYWLIITGTGGEPDEHRVRATGVLSAGASLPVERGLPSSQRVGVTNLGVL